MKMKSLKTQFIGAIAMVLVAAVAMGSSTYAWFAMNLSVKADGMQVQVKSDSTFLLIQETSAVSGDDEAAKAANVQSTALTKKTLTVQAADADVYPSKPWAAADGTTYTHAATEITEPVTNYAAAGVTGNWITANNQDPAQSTSNIANDKALTATNLTTLSHTFADYVIKKSVTMTLSVGSEAAHNLWVTGNIVPQSAATTDDTTAAEGYTYYDVVEGNYTKLDTTVGNAIPSHTGTLYKSALDITAVKVLVVTDDNNITTLDYTMNGTKTSLHAVDDEEFTSSSVVVADIYIYYDGSAASVFSNNKANLDAANIDLVFTVEVGAGAHA